MRLGRPYRYTFALVAALIGVGLLVPGVGVAAPSTPTVTFNGGCGVGGVGAVSEPDANTLSVPAEGMAIFVNHLGQSATLLVDGRPAGTLRANDEVPVVFHHGPVTIKLTPACLPAPAAVSVSVRVVGGAPRRAGQAAPGASHPAVARARDTLPRRHASTVLVLVSAICVIGVSTSTIRAIIAQRAIRTASA